MNRILSHVRTIGILLAFGLLMAISAAAHCDTLHGPVVADARRALKSGEITPALKWVKAEYEAEVRNAFARTLRVRAQGGDGAELADTHFFETLVRLHRMGEGEPYTGLKDSADVEPWVAAADLALERGDVTPLIKGTPADVADSIRERFARVKQARLHADDDLPSGRAYVTAYIEFIHYVDALHTGGRTSKHAEASPEPSPTPEPSPAAKAEIAEFTAANTRLKKNAETKVRLVFRVEPSGAKLDWRMSCQGVVIKGWTSAQVLSIAERQERGAIQTIEGRDFLGSNPAVTVTIKRPKTLPTGNEAGCIASVQTQGLEPQQKAIPFELR